MPKKIFTPWLIVPILALTAAWIFFPQAFFAGESHYDRGVAYYTEDRYEEALEEFKAHLREQPDHLQSQQWITVIYSARPDLAEKASLAPALPSPQPLPVEIETPKTEMAQEILKAKPEPEAPRPLSERETQHPRADIPGLQKKEAPVMPSAFREEIEKPPLPALPSQALPSQQGERVSPLETLKTLRRAERRTSGPMIALLGIALLILIATVLALGALMFRIPKIKTKGAFTPKRAPPRSESAGAERSFNPKELVKYLTGKHPKPTKNERELFS